MNARLSAIVWSALVGLGAACGEAASTGDPYYGPIDAAALDSKLRASTTGCPPGVTSCYRAQSVSLKGSTIKVHNLGTIASGLNFGVGGTLPGSLISGAPYAYNFPTQCTPEANFDPYEDAYSNAKQFPVFSALPLQPASPSTVVLPIVRVAPVGGVSGNQCNALKRTQSIEAGMFSAAPSAHSAAPAHLWAVIDPAALVVPLTSASTFDASHGWFRGLLLSYLDGGPIPTTGSEIRTMEAVIVDSNPGPASATTDADVIILPYGPSDTADYSPFVRLRHVLAAANTPPSTYKRLCTSVPTGAIPACAAAADEVDLAITGAPAETIIIVAAP